MEPGSVRFRSLRVTFKRENEENKENKENKANASRQSRLRQEPTKRG
jgi:hypothetical protein